MNKATLVIALLVATNGFTLYAHKKELHAGLMQGGYIRLGDGTKMDGVILDGVTLEFSSVQNFNLDDMTIKGDSKLICDGIEYGTAAEMRELVNRFNHRGDRRTPFAHRPQAAHSSAPAAIASLQ